MKTTWLSWRIPVALAVGFLFAGGMLGGCSDDDGGGGGGTGPASSAISIEEILFNPKSLGPGDTLLVTVIVTSESGNVGDFVTFEWTASGGDWVEANRSDKSTVRWRAPADKSGIYSFQVTAKNSVSSASLTDQVFVGRLEDFIDQGAGQLFVIPSGTALYYTSAPGAPGEGLVLRSKDGPTDEAVFDLGHKGTRYSFDTHRRNEAHSFVEKILYTKNVVVHDDLVARTQTVIARDGRDFAVRWNEFTRPGVSPDGQLICCQGGLLDQTGTPAQGGVDTFAVHVYHIATQTTRRATFRGNSENDSVSNCFHPSISSDNRHVVFISDRKEPLIWEYYALPIEGGAVVADTIPDALIELSDTGGKITSGDPVPSAVTKSQWNPSPANPVLASVGADNRLRLIHTGGGGARLVDVAGEVADIRWAPGGDYLVASVSDPDGRTKIYRIPALGDGYELLWEALKGDRITELSVSSDGALLVYANKRGQDIWYELIETGRAIDDPPAVRITGAWTPGAAAIYGSPLQSLRPAWASTSRVVYLFFMDESTPRVMSLDLSGIGG